MGGCGFSLKVRRTEGNGGRGQWEAEMGVGWGAGGAEGWCRLGEVRDEVDSTWRSGGLGRVILPHKNWL